MPQSDASTSRDASTYGSARLTRSTMTEGDSTTGSERSSTPRMIVLSDSAVSTEQSSDDWAVSMEICSTSHAASSGRNEYPSGRSWMTAA
jgi:hypothetical protein